MKGIMFIVVLISGITSAFAQTGSYNPYIPQIPMDAYIKVGMAKQKLYNDRADKLHDLVDDCREYVNDLSEDYPEKGRLATDYYNKVLNELNRVAGKYDLTVDKNYYSLRKYILQIKEYSRNLRAEARKEEKEKE